jgi:hypothetical protein
VLFTHESYRKESMTKINKIIRSWLQALPKEGVVGFYGHRRMGKTGTAWSLAEGEMEKGRPVAAYLFPKKARHLLPKSVKHASTAKEMAKLKGYLIVADELAIHANTREFNSDPNKELYKLMAIAAQCHQLLFLICQHTRQLDVGLVMEPDLIVFKKPSLLHIRFARPELRVDVQAAWDAFEKARGDKRAWSYVVDFHDGRTGFLKNKLPSFWSQELSKAYALYELTASLNENGKKKAKKRKGKKKKDE